MNEQEMNAFEFVDFNKIKRIQGKLSLLGMYGLKQDCIIEDQDNLKISNNIKKVIEEKEENIHKNNV